MEYTMIIYSIIRRAASILMSLLISLNVNAQDDNFDIGAWYIMKVAEADKDALQRHIHTVFVSVKDSTGEKIVTRKVYDKSGYLKHRVDYSLDNRRDSIETTIKRVSFNEIILRCRFIGKGNYNVDDEENPWLFLGKYVDTSSGSYWELTKSYKRLSGKIVSVVSSLNGVIQGKSEFRLMDTVKQKKRYFPGDTTHIHDTIVVTKQEKDGWGILLEVKMSFLKGIADPVKTEYLKYVNDSLVYHNVEVDEYDKKKRKVSHSVFWGIPLVRYEFKRTIYNDLTGERTETHGYNPVSGKPELIWQYDNQGRIRYYERTGVTDIENGKVVYERDKGCIEYKYNQKGLLAESISSANDVPVVCTYYQYTYY